MAETKTLINKSGRDFRCFDSSDKPERDFNYETQVNVNEGMLIANIHQQLIP